MLKSQRPPLVDVKHFSERLPLPYLEWCLAAQDFGRGPILEVDCSHECLPPQLMRKVRCSEEKLAGSADDGTKPMLGDGVPLRDIGGATRFLDSERLTRSRMCSNVLET